MLDDRTMKRAPKRHALERWPHAMCEQVPGMNRYVVLSNETGQPRFIGEGRCAWDAWMEAEVHPRTDPRDQNGDPTHD